MQPSIPEFLTDLPQGWRVVTANVTQLGDDDPPFGASYEDLLENFIIVHSDRLEIGLEMDWFPERSPSGQFTLSAIDFSDPEKLRDSYAKPIRKFTTRSLRRAVDEMRKWMLELTKNGKTA